MRAGRLSPTPEELARALESDLAWIAAALGSGIADVSPVSPLRGRERPRTAFRVALEDGRVVKLRRMKSRERARELARLLVGVAPLGLPQVVARREEALVMEWIAGVPLADPREVRRRVAEAGALLGRLHTTSSPDGSLRPTVRSTNEELHALDDDLRCLVEAGRLAPTAAERLGERVRRLVPPQTRYGLTHGDLCPENLLVDARGALRVVDNESLQIAPLALDLVRTGARWPLSGPAWLDFLAAYRGASHEEFDAAELEGWRIRTLALSARYRVTHGLAGVAESLARLEAHLPGGWQGAPGPD